MSERITEAELKNVEDNLGVGVNPLWLVAELRRLRRLIMAAGSVAPSSINADDCCPWCSASHNSAPHAPNCSYCVLFAEAEAIRREQEAV